MEIGLLLPEHTTIPVAFQIGAVGVMGTVSFQVPQQISSFTLILIPQKGDNGDQSSTGFSFVVACAPKLIYYSCFLIDFLLACCYNT